MIQEVIVAVIGVAVILLLIYKVYSFFADDNKSKGSCGCSSCHCNTSEKAKKYRYNLD